ncbi:MAG: hypothetical protein WD231_02665 [Candidatus Woykebacteria bacterium]
MTTAESSDVIDDGGPTLETIDSAWPKGEDTVPFPTRCWGVVDVKIKSAGHIGNDQIVITGTTVREDTTYRVIISRYNFEVRRGGTITLSIASC